jgi:radical SAM protein (TIGR01212 family)
LHEGIDFFAKKYQTQQYLAYFQAYSNTYSDFETLKRYYDESLSVKGIVGLVIATRPDCINEELLNLLRQYANKYYIGLEYGIESCSNETLNNIHRGHTFEDSVNALELSKDRGLHVGLHYIIGLPGDCREDNLKHASILSGLPFETIKLHQLQIIKDTLMAKQYEQHPEMFNLFDLDEYIDFIVSFSERLSPKIIIERFVSESPFHLLIAPKWGGLKNFEITEKIHKKFLERQTFQGRAY